MINFLLVNRKPGFQLVIYKLLTGLMYAIDSSSQYGTLIRLIDVASVLFLFSKSIQGIYDGECPNK